MPACLMETQIQDEKCFAYTPFPNFNIPVIFSAKMTLHNLFSHLDIYIHPPLQLHRYINDPLIPTKANIGRN